jgi:hypothetical protein
LSNDERALKDRTAFEDLRDFLFDHVATYDELETLLLLQRQPALDWEVNATAQTLRFEVDRCEVALENLTTNGLLARSGSPVTFRYAPASKALAEAAERLQRAYLKDPLAIVQLMTTNAMDRVKAAALARLGGVLHLRAAKKLP